MRRATSWLCSSAATPAGLLQCRHSRYWHMTAEAALDMIRSGRYRLLLVPDGVQHEQPPSPAREALVLDRAAAGWEEVRWLVGCCAESTDGT